MFVRTFPAGFFAHSEELFYEEKCRRFMVSFSLAFSFSSVPSLIELRGSALRRRIVFAGAFPDRCACFVDVIYLE